MRSTLQVILQDIEAIFFKDRRKLQKRKYGSLQLTDKNPGFETCIWRLIASGKS